eukprot:824710_1
MKLCTNLVIMAIVACIVMGILILNNGLFDTENDTLIPLVNVYNDKPLETNELERKLATDELKVKQWNYVYFQHIRKTGGTSVVDGVFHRNDLCAANRCITWSVFGGLDKTIDDHKHKCDQMGMKLIVNEWYPFYTSHYLIHKDDKWNDVLLTTILRDPIQRVWSDMSNAATFACGGMNNTIGPEWKQRIQNESLLIECVEQYQYAYTSNVYVKIFSGSWKYAIIDHEKHLPQHNIDYNPLHMAHKVHLNVAKSIIMEFDVILLLDMWDETHIQLICNGIYDTTLKQYNMGHTKQQLDDFPKLKQLLYKLNQYDIEFFQFAKTLALEKSEKCREHRYREFQSGT